MFTTISVNLCQPLLNFRMLSRPSIANDKRIQRSRQGLRSLPESPKRYAMPNMRDQPAIVGQNDAAPEIRSQNAGSGETGRTGRGRSH